MINSPNKEDVPLHRHGCDMGNYITNAPHKKAVRFVHILAYLTLILLLADVVLFVIYSLKGDNENDSYIFFTITLFSILACALHAAVGISLPHSGKFGYYKVPMYVFILGSMVGLWHGARSLTAQGQTFNETMPYIFYTVFFVGCVVTNVLILRFHFGSITRKVATGANLVLILLLMLHMGDIIYTMCKHDPFTNSLPSKHSTIRLISNTIYLVTAVSSLVTVRIKPKDKEYHDITEN